MSSSSHSNLTMEFWSFLSLVVLFSLLPVLISSFTKTEQPRKPLPGPKKLPLIGNFHQITGSLHISLCRLANHHGPLMMLQLGSIPTLVISSAQLARDIFNNHDLVFSGRPPLYAARRLSYNLSDITFTPYGEYWREVRKITVIELLSMKRVQSFNHVRADEVNRMLDSVASSPILVDLSKLTLSFTNNLIRRIAFGKQDDGTYKFHDILQETQHLLGDVNIADFFPWLSWVNKFNGVDPRLERNFKELDMYYDQVIEEHRDPSRPRLDDHKDLVDVLLGVQKNQTQPIRLTNDQIKGVLTDMFVAGTDTSAATLVWTMVELIKNPKAMKRAQEEITDIVGGKEKVEEGDLPKLPYLKLVLKESFRLHPPLPLLVPRETTQACTINGYEIPAKTRVLINVKAISMDPTCWEDPDSFKPERFSGSAIDFKGRDFELIPFGAGRRGCPGISFGVVTVELAVANLLHCFDWEMPHGMERNNIDMRQTDGLVKHKKTPLVVVATPRPCRSVEIHLKAEA